MQRRLSLAGHTPRISPELPIMTWNLMESITDNALSHLYETLVYSRLEFHDIISMPVPILNLLATGRFSKGREFKWNVFVKITIMNVLTVTMMSSLKRLSNLNHGMTTRSAADMVLTRVVLSKRSWLSETFTRYIMLPNTRTRPIRFM